MNRSIFQWRLSLPILSILCIAALVTCTGCTGAGDSPDPAGPVTGNISQLALLDGEIPFTVAATQVQSAPGEVTGSNGDMPVPVSMYSVFYTDGTSSSTIKNMLIHAVIEYSGDNATVAFEVVRRTLASDTRESRMIVETGDPHIGDQSVALSGSSGIGPDGSLKAKAILFRKANILEMVMYTSHDPSQYDLTTIARTAAAKIPARGLKSPAAAEPAGR